MNVNDRLLRRLGHPSLGRGLSLGQGLSGGQQWNPQILFANGEPGLIWDFSDASKVFSDAGTTRATLDGAIGRIVDMSPNGVNGNQTTADSKPLWKSSGGKYFALFDGSNDWLQTASIDFSGTDKVTVFAGVRKLSDAARGMVVELSAIIGSNAGSFALDWPVGSADTRASFNSRGSATAVGSLGPVGAAPITNVLTGIADIGGDNVILRTNGVAGTAGTTDQGTGNFGNYPLYVGRRGGTTLPLNGQIFCLIIVGRACSTAEILAAEAWVNARTGAY